MEKNGGGGAESTVLKMIAQFLESENAVVWLRALTGNNY